MTLCYNAAAPEQRHGRKRFYQITVSRHARIFRLWHPVPISRKMRLSAARFLPKVTASQCEQQIVARPVKGFVRKDGIIYKTGGGEILLAPNP
jgi:hypothetical protein